MGTTGQSNLFQLLTMTKFVQKLNVLNRENDKSSEE